jgi:hypothetical protein
MSRSSSKARFGDVAVEVLKPGPHKAVEDRYDGYRETPDGSDSSDKMKVPLSPESTSCGSATPPEPETIDLFHIRINDGDVCADKDMNELADRLAARQYFIL